MAQRILTALLGITIIMVHAAAGHAAPASIDPAALKLPEERLMLIAGNSKGAVFMAPDSVKWTGRSADVLVYRLFQPAREVDGKIAIEEVEVQRFDCDAQTYQSLGVAEFDAAGQNIFAMPEEPVQPIRERTMTSRVAGIVCGQVQLPPGNIAKDRAMAKAMAMQALSNLR